MSRPALISTDDAGPRAVIQGAIELAKRKGLQVVFADAYPEGTTNFSAILTKVRAANPDVLGAAANVLEDGVAITRPSSPPGRSSRAPLLTRTAPVRFSSRPSGAPGLWTARSSATPFRRWTTTPSSADSGSIGMGSEDLGMALTFAQGQKVPGRKSHGHASHAAP